MKQRKPKAAGGAGKEERESVRQGERDRGTERARDMKKWKMEKKKKSSEKGARKRIKRDTECKRKNTHIDMAPLKHALKLWGVG